MNTIFTMTLMGSVMTLFYMLGRVLLKRTFSYRRRYLWLNMAVLTYIIPLPFLKSFYGGILRRNLPGLTAPELSYYTQQNQIVFKTQRGIMLSDALDREMAVLLLWCTGALLILLYKSVRYLCDRRRLLQSCGSKDRDWQETGVKGISEKYGIRRKVKVYGGIPDKGAFCIGIWRPVVFLGDIGTGETEEAVLHHEMVHIKRFDTVWQILGILAVCIHWYNPLVYLLVRERSRVCEMSCDDIVTESMSMEERSKYARVVASQAVVGGRRVVLAQNLTKEGEKLKERIENIMSNKAKCKWRNVVTGVVMAVGVFASSLTVFAYDDVDYINVGGRILSEGEQWECVFVPEGVSVQEGEKGFIEDYNKEILYDFQFVDEEGNIYELNDQNAVAPRHKHNFGKGTANVHTKDGAGCKVVTYNSERCFICGYVNILDEICTTYYPVCIH